MKKGVYLFFSVFFVLFGCQKDKDEPIVEQPPLGLGETVDISGLFYAKFEAFELSSGAPWTREAYMTLEKTAPGYYNLCINYIPEYPEIECAQSITWVFQDHAEIYGTFRYWKTNSLQMGNLSSGTVHNQDSITGRFSGISPAVVEGKFSLIRVIDE